MLDATKKNTQTTHACPVCGKQIPEAQVCCPECKAAYLAFLAV